MKNGIYFLSALLLLIALFYSCSKDSKSTIDIEETHYHCDAENKDGNKFTGSEQFFFGADSQSAEHAKSGKYSCKTNENQPFALTTEFRNVKKGEIIHAQIWAYNPTEESLGNLIIADNSGVQYDDNAFPVETDGKWKLLSNTFTAAADFDVVKVYGINSKLFSVYFDDLSITKLSAVPKPQVTDSTLRIFIPPSEFSQLDSFLTEGRKEMILKKQFKRYVNGFILQHGDSTPVKLRLKGDWTDHLKTDKFSLRIKVRGNNAYNGLKSFSIQSPETRGMMLEWYIHQICDEEDLLTTRYEFVNVEINGVVKGVYALEEHFDKQLLEARNRREGPIVKLDEEGLWELNYDLDTKPKKILSPAFLSSSILPFKKNRTYKTPTLHEQFLVAQSHLNKYKNLENNSENFLNLEAFAKYIAILDLGNVNHAQTWHNQRQYYNPVTAKLEPILYDCYQDKHYIDSRRLFFMVDEVLTDRRPTNLNLALLRDENFRNQYAEYVTKIGSVEYIESFNKKYANSIKDNLELLGQEYPFYEVEMDLAFFKHNALAMETENDSMVQFMKNFKEVTFVKDEWPAYDDTTDYFRPSIGLKAHIEFKEGDMMNVSLRNFHQSNISIRAYSTDSLPKELILLDQPVNFNAFTSDFETKHVLLPSQAKYLHYAPKNLGGRLVREKISKWPLPSDISVLGDYLDLKKYKSQGVISLPKGTYSFDQNVVANHAEKLVIAAGTHIDLVNSAGFISYIPVELNGTKKNPITISSSDSTASGFNVFTEHGHSTLTHVQFKGLNSMNKNHWILTGAVTLYGGSVNIEHCQFKDNQCEDALNIIRSEFKVNECFVSNTLSDGFDADFCKGVLSNSIISFTRNDALDFSGSQIQIVNCEITDAGDKGISGGENSQLIISDTDIDSAVIGIAAKDFSTLEVMNVTLRNCNYPYAAFRKKPEYGPASITVSSSELINGRMLIDLNSTITINSKTTVGTEKLDIESLYLNQ